jgi:hypothetical protein
VVTPGRAISASYAVRTDPAVCKNCSIVGRAIRLRFVEGEPKSGGAPYAVPASAFTKAWIGDRVPRQIDALSLTAMSDAFFARIFHVRNQLLPFGTVSLTTYFHADAAELMAEDITHVLGVGDAEIFHKNYADQTGELWSPAGRLLATSHQIAYFKA